MARHNERGAAAVEFALVLVPLVILLIGTVEFGWAMYAQANVSAAARAGARELALHDPVADGPAAATSKSLSTLSGLSLPGAATVTPNGACSAGGTASVNIDYTHRYLTGFFGQNIILRGQGSFRCSG